MLDSNDGYYQYPPYPRPERRLGRRMGLRGPLSHPDDPRRPAAALRPVRGLQCPALARPLRGAVADVAPRLPPLGGGLPTDPALAPGRLLRGHCRGFAPPVAAGPGTQPPALGGHLRQSDPAEHPRERDARWLRRAQAEGKDRSSTWQSIPLDTSWPCMSRQPTNRIGPRSVSWRRRSRRPLASTSSWGMSIRGAPARWWRRLPPSMASNSMWSSWRKPSRVSSSCRAVGWPSAPSPGRAASGAWSATTSGCRRRSRACIMLQQIVSLLAGP